jgi:hypothetical protein
MKTLESRNQRSRWCQYRLSGTNQFINLASLLNPFSIALGGMFGDLMEKVHRFRFITRFTGFIQGDNHFDIDGNYKPAARNQTSTLNSFSWNTHDLNISYELF